MVSQGEIVAASLEDYLDRHVEIQNRISNTGQLKVFTSGDAKEFVRQAKELLSIDLDVQSI